jgi:BolA-like protein 1
MLLRSLLSVEKLGLTIFAQKMSVSTGPQPIENSIRLKLMEHFQPKHLEILNESYMHNVPKGSETHFKVLVVSEKFESLPLIQVCNVAHCTVSTQLIIGFLDRGIVKSTQHWSMN